MTKNELIRRTAARAHLPISMAHDIIDALAEEIAVALTTGETVHWQGLCEIGTRARLGRAVRDFKTGVQHRGQDSILPYIKPGKALKDALQRRDPRAALDDGGTTDGSC